MPSSPTTMSKSVDFAHVVDILEGGGDDGAAEGKEVRFFSQSSTLGSFPTFD